MLGDDDGEDERQKNEETYPPLVSHDLPLHKSRFSFFPDIDDGVTSKAATVVTLANYSIVFHATFSSLFLLCRRGVYFVFLPFCVSHANRFTMTSVTKSNELDAFEARHAMCRPVAQIFMRGDGVAHRRRAKRKTRH